MTDVLVVDLTGTPLEVVDLGATAAEDTALVAGPALVVDLASVPLEVVDLGGMPVVEGTPIVAGPPGPPGSLGPAGPAGPPGPAGAAGTAEGAGYRYYQSTASALWVINHPLPFRPNVTVVDSTGREIWPGEVLYPTDATVQLSFSAAFGGEAYLS